MPTEDSPQEEESVGERIRRLRLERGMSLARVAGTDFSRAYLSQVEQGQSRPSTRILRLVADRLGTGVEILLEGEARFTDLDLALERGRVLLAQGGARRALSLLEALEPVEPHRVVELELVRAVALRRLGDRPAQDACLRRAAALAGGDALLSRRVARVAAGGGLGQDWKAELKEAREALRAGDREAALQRFRAARVLLEAAGS